jgi:adenylyl-sulfate kinase
MEGLTIWLTGLSGAGKSTMGQELERVLLERGLRVELLDGDEVRTNLSKGLGFSKEDRDINVRRIGYVCKLLSRNGVVAIAAAISPYREVRREVREMMDRFVEVYMECPIEVLTERDPKGLYERALKGEIPNFTGISDPYEPPEEAEIVCDTDKETVEESVTKVVRSLELMGYIPTEEGRAVLSPEKESVVRERLQALGYRES